MPEISLHHAWDRGRPARPIRRDNSSVHHEHPGAANRKQKKYNRKEPGAAKPQPKMVEMCPRIARICTNFLIFGFECWVLDIQGEEVRIQNSFFGGTLSSMSLCACGVSVGERV